VRRLCGCLILVVCGAVDAMILNTVGHHGWPWEPQMRIGSEPITRFTIVDAALFAVLVALHVLGLYLLFTRGRVSVPGVPTKE
jgi:hypothetical protein